MTGQIIHESGNLRLEIRENEKEITVLWFGKSAERDPGKFLIPVLKEIIEKAVVNDQIVILDFCKFEYMNSSTITPIVRLLSHIDPEIKSVKLFYDKSLRWQVMNFSALQVLNARDKRIEITGV